MHAPPPREPLESTIGGELHAPARRPRSTRGRNRCSTTSYRWLCWVEAELHRSARRISAAGENDIAASLERTVPVLESLAKRWPPTNAACPLLLEQLHALYILMIVVSLDLATERGTRAIRRSLTALEEFGTCLGDPCRFLFYA